jgi:hypothetical protein
MPVRERDRVLVSHKAPFGTSQCISGGTLLKFVQNLELTFRSHHLPALIHRSAPMVFQGCKISAFFIRAALSSSSSTSEISGVVEE